jgi:septal ring factor EnvC (AmiA/AmiB activator)
MRSIIFSCLGAITVLTAGLISNIGADEISDKRSRLEDIKDELESKRALYDSLGVKEKSESERLRDIEQQVNLSDQLLLKITRESDRLKKTILTQKVELQTIHALRDDRARLLKQRLVYIYKMGERLAWLEFLSSGNPTSALAGYRNLKSLVEYDQGLITSYHDLTVSLEDGLKRFQANVSDLETLQGDQKKELSNRQKTLDSRKKLVNKLKNDKSEVERSITGLENDAKDIAGIIEDLERQALTAGPEPLLPGLSNNKGNLIWPSRGKIIRGFGPIRDKRGIELTNPGIDIEAKLGADVLAAATGVVMYVNWLRGYGQFLIVDHGAGYYTLYANLSDVLVESGDHVTAGELIALVGDSGSLEGPKLHFEVRYKKDQLNPLEWLR